MWDKKVHVKSSMPQKEGQWHLFIGRWQPLHDGHKQMFQQILDSGGKVCIGIRTMEHNENNPYPSENVYKMLYEEYGLNPNVYIMFLPDICSVNFGRNVGYDIVEHIPPEEIASISATEIRKSKSNL